MNERVEYLRNVIQESEPCVCLERAIYYTESWKETEGKPVAIRRALALKNILEKQTVHILKGELIVGNQTGKLNATPIFPEYGLEWLVKEVDNLNNRKLDRYHIENEDKELLKELNKYWKGKTQYDLAKEEILSALPEEYRKYYDPEECVFNAVLSNSGRMTTGDGHVIANFEKILNKGLRAIIEEAILEIKKCNNNLQNMDNIKKKIFLESVIISLEAAISFARRYSEEAEKMAKMEDDKNEKTILMQISENLRRVPEYPAETFWQALQAYWFMHMLLQIESNGHSMSFGRFDQYLYPFYKKDLDEGRINEDKALELIECFLIKCNQIKKIRQESHTRKMHGYPMFQTLTIGGQTRSGTDATNKISYLVLKAVADIKMQEPTVVVRIHSKTPNKFLLEACETVIKHGGGLPGFFNDEVAIPLLMNTGVSLEDARDWAIVGCCEPVVPGKHNTINGGCCHLNLLKIFEMAMNDGYCDITNSKLCKGIGTLDQFNSYEQVVEAYKKQLEFYISFIPIFDNITSEAHAKLTPCPLLSGVLDYRIQYGHDVEEGGGPNYNNTLSIAHGSVNVGNSLYAIKKAVFEDKLFSAKELKEALDNNFAGEKGQRIKKQLLHLSKYGNDNDEVDFIVRDSLNWYLKGIAKYTPVRGGHYCPSPQTLSANAYTGEIVGATPDGRSAGEPMADNVSPSAGSDINGVTATLSSVAKLDHAYATNGTILNVKLHPTAVSGDERKNKFAALIKGYFDLKGFQVQFNIVSTETLKDAQKNPQKYRNLIVKVAGYSALFTKLDTQLQNQIIARTEHVM
ncbi:glycyl radical protein [Thermoanaerobacteraceae bacterium SP2]|jgi:formate C-acetyltransferase|nr:glycyl radical protein [Thermoanaerobacteraceae bacterium SP2]